MSPKTKIGLLVAWHFIGQIACASAIYNIGLHYLPPIIGLFALVLVEAGLLGIWAALGATRPRWRLLVVLAATAYLCALVSATFKADELHKFVMAFLVVALPTTAIVLVLNGCRHSQRRLRLVQLAPGSSASEGFQFSIRQLLVATAIAAGLLALSRGLGDLPTTGQAWQITVFFVIVVPYVVLVELGTLWGALGIGRPLPRLLVVLPTAFVVGTMPPFFLDIRYRHLDQSVLIAWSCFMGLQATILAASLLVIRTSGWRLVRGEGNTAVADEHRDESSPIVRGDRNTP